MFASSIIRIDIYESELAPEIGNLLAPHPHYYSNEAESGRKSHHSSNGEESLLYKSFGNQLAQDPHRFSETSYFRQP